MSRSEYLTHIQQELGMFVHAAFVVVRQDEANQLIVCDGDCVQFFFFFLTNTQGQRLVVQV